MIYFIRRPDGLIKIGTTLNLSDRLPQLIKEYGAGLEVLAVARGSHPTETQLHRRFAHLNASVGSSREWFKAEVELLDFIATEAKPWHKPKLSTVRCDCPIVTKAKVVAQHLGLSLSEVLSEAARVQVDRLYLKAIRELESQGE